MVIYEYKTNYLNIFGALFWVLIVIGFSIGCIAFFPLLRKTLAPVVSGLKRNCNVSGLFPLGLSKQLNLSILSLLIYGVFISGIIVGIFETVSHCVEYSEMRNTHSIAGQLHSMEYEPFEYRGEEMGFTLQFYLDGQCFAITEPPGISAKSLEALQNAVSVTVIYSVCKDTNVVTKIVINST